MRGDIDIEVNVVNLISLGQQHSESSKVFMKIQETEI